MKSNKKKIKSFKPIYTLFDKNGNRWRMEGSRPVSELADKVMADCKIQNKKLSVGELSNAKLLKEFEIAIRYDLYDSRGNMIKQESLFAMETIRREIISRMMNPNITY